MTNKVKVALVDDELLFRKGIRLFLDSREEIEVVFDTGNGNELMEYLEQGQNQPDIVLMDIRMPQVDGIATSKLINQHFPHVRILVLSSITSDYIVEQMLQIGVSGYLVKNTHPEELLKSILQVHQTGLSFNNSPGGLVMNEQRNKLTRTLEISDRELEVLQLICQQCSTKEIAETLFISERTVEGHRQKLLEKTDSKNVVGLILWGMKNQIITIEPL